MNYLNLNSENSEITVQISLGILDMKIKYQVYSLSDYMYFFMFLRVLVLSLPVVIYLLAVSCRDSFSGNSGVISEVVLLLVFCF